MKGAAIYGNAAGHLATVVRVEFCRIGAILDIELNGGKHVRKWFWRPSEALRRAYTFLDALEARGWTVDRP